MKKVLLSLARASIKSHFIKGHVDVSSIEEEYPELLKQGASFVTLSQDGKLRGCMGSILAHRSLVDDVLNNAQSAAFRDPRFDALEEEELEGVSIEVSVLSEPKLLVYTDIQDLKEKITEGVDGVILKQGYHQATFLPQVWEELKDFDAFFSHLCQKAGLSMQCLQSHPEISVYQVEKIKDD
ncbi:MAG: AmmeMemoRadiSam system protein A [Sulfurovum sp.]|uniref:AmmeMemoRadiSam system protein A n=1 Tax=Sulfurovum sp. TaxID=1969726 RepID=UPI002867BF06|nr:AmmeMemoRadiSam system protein A [Sulfurovum sp.]MCO4846306.1 AmmeMemoRadiSam system protein A [Sulfurovum sp.]